MAGQGEEGPRVSFLAITVPEKTFGAIHKSLGNNIHVCAEEVSLAGVRGMGWTIVTS